MTTAGLNPDIIVFLIAAGWVALKFFSTLKEQRVKDRERAGSGQRAAPGVPPGQVGAEEWKPFDSPPELPTVRTAPTKRAPPRVLPMPTRVRAKLVTVAKARARIQEPAPDETRATVADVKSPDMPVLPTAQVRDGHMPAASATSAEPILGAEKAQAPAFKLIPRSRSTAFRRRIVIHTRQPGSLRQAVVLSEVLGRPRAFDV